MILAVSFTVFFSYFYIKYDRIIEKRFRTPVFANSAKIYALPQDGANRREISMPRKLPPNCGAPATPRKIGRSRRWALSG